MNRLSTSRGRRRLNTALVVALACLYGATIVYTLARGKAVDFSLYYLAAYGFAHGDDVYRAGAQRDADGHAVWEHLADAAGIVAYAPPYRYPPLTAVLVWPLTFLPPRGATILWLAASALALIVSAWLIGRAGETTFGVPVALALLMGFGPAVLTLYAGQVNAFVLLMLAWAFSARMRGRYGTAGAAVAVGAMLKLVPLAHLAYFGWCRQWRALGVGTLVLIASLVVSLPLVGWHGLVSYAQHAIALSGLHGLSAAPGDQSLGGFCSRLLIAGGAATPQSAWWIARLSSVACIVATVALCTPAAATPSTFRWQWALVTTTLSLVPPYVWYHQLILLLLPLFVLSEYGLAHASERWTLVPLAIGYVATGTFGVAWRSLQHPVLASMPFLTTILLWVLLARLLIKMRLEKSGRDHPS
jgi:alpha-1,2-mannosyltransferase